CRQHSKWPQLTF
nr:immunoglobulin light chain junction region [Macaca mulatta]